MKKRFPALILLASITCLTMFAEENDSTIVKAESKNETKNEFYVEAQLFTRGEVRNGGLDGTKHIETDENHNRANFINERTRLTVGYNRDWLSAKVTVQHSGVWGQGGGGTFNLYETWAQLSSKFGLFTRIGRQALAYDDERIIGTEDWSMAASSHNALKIGYEGYGHKVHLIGAYNQNAESVNGGTYYINGYHPYKSLLTLWYHYDLPKFPLGISLTAMNTGMQLEQDDLAEKIIVRTKYQQLLGTYLKFYPKHWNAEASYYRQMGRSEQGLKINAWMASAKVTYSPIIDKYGFTAGYDYLSGDKLFAVPHKGQIGLIRHDVIRGFNPIYGSHHKFYGAMDFFYVSTFVSGFTPGLQNLYGGGFFSPIKGLRFNVLYHHFAIAANLPDLKKNLGDEIEITGEYTFLKCVTLKAGYSFMKGTETMERLRRSTEDRRLSWGWVSLTVSPSLFTTKW